MAKTVKIDPNAVLDYEYDWNTTEDGKTPWLAENETITDHTLTATDGITVESSSENLGVVTMWVSGATGQWQRITCHVVTSDGREDDRTFRFQVEER